MTIKIVTWIARIVFGVAFIFAGFTKAIDPLGSVYIFDDYFVAFGMDWMMPLSLPLAIIMNTLEFLVGVTILLGLKMRLSAWVGLLFMIFFTPLTLYIAITDAVPHCGCFGDAWVITNWETFYKNLVLLAAVIIIFKQKDKISPLWSPKKDWWLVGVVTVLIIWLSVFCYRNLPIIDFRPWKVGNDITEQLQPAQEEIAEYTFVYENLETGEKKEFDSDNIPSAEEGWEFVERKENIIQEYIASPIENFMIMDEFSVDITEDIIGYPGYNFLVVAYDLNTTNKDAFNYRLGEIATGAQGDDIPIVGLTSSSFEKIHEFSENHDIYYDFYQSDERELKTIVRSNPGLILMKDGVVKGKWHYRNIPAYEEVNKEYLQ